jgi:hypothetical protein
LLDFKILYRVNEQQAINRKCSEYSQGNFHKVSNYP